MIIYVDMDGVLTDFFSACARLLGCPERGTFGKCPPTKYQIGSMLPDIPAPVQEEACWTRIEAAGVAFWENMDPLPWCDPLMTALSTLAPTRVLTSPGRVAASATGKIRWLQRRWGRSFQNYVITRNKTVCAHARAILVDDSFDNILAWTEAADGADNGILFPAPYNVEAPSTTGTGIALIGWSPWL